VAGDEDLQSQINRQLAKLTQNQGNTLIEIEKNMKDLE